MSHITSKWSKAGLKFQDRDGMNDNTIHFSFDCSMYDGMKNEEFLHIKSSTDSLEVNGISILWDEVFDKKEGINLHRLEEESRSAIASSFKLPVDTPLQDIVATQTSLSYEAKKKAQISRSYFNEFRQKLENATEIALTKIASKTKLKFYPVSQADAESLSHTLMEDRRKMGKFFSYSSRYWELSNCTGEIEDPKVFIIIIAKFGRKGDYIRIVPNGIGRDTRIERIFNNRHRPYYFDLSTSTKEEAEAYIEAGIADAIVSIIEDGRDIIIDK